MADILSHFCVVGADSYLYAVRRKYACVCRGKICHFRLAPVAYYRTYHTACIFLCKLVSYDMTVSAVYKHIVKLKFFRYPYGGENIVRL